MADNDCTQKPSLQSNDPQLKKAVYLEEHTNSSNPKKTTKIITIQEKPQTAISYWSWNNSDWKSPQDCVQTLQKSNLKTGKPRSRQLFFWETLITVGLLVMALWMQTQTLTTRQPTETVNNKSLPLLEMVETPEGF